MLPIAWREFSGGMDMLNFLGPGRLDLAANNGEEACESLEYSLLPTILWDHAPYTPGTHATIMATAHSTTLEKCQFSLDIS